MVRSLGRLALATCAVWASSTASAQDLAEVDARLATLVDLPTPRDRQAAVRALLKEDELAPLDMWLAACATFAPVMDAELAEPGLHTRRVTLHDVDGHDVEGELILYIPRSAQRDRPSPLLVAMHGTGGRGAHMVGMWQALAERHGLLLLCPTEPGPNEGFAATDAERDAVLAALRWTRRHLDVDENAVFLTGFSRGGHLTWDLGLRHPDRWAALAPMVGGPRFELGRGAANMRYLENILHVPLWDLQGALDQAGLVWSVREAFQRLRAIEAPRAQLFEFPALGHSVDMQAVDWDTFFAFRRDPLEAERVRRVARLGEGRNGWIDCTAVNKTVQEIFQPELRAAEAARLDDDDKRRFVIDATLARTGRVAASQLAPGRIQLGAEGVTRVALLLSEQQLGALIPAKKPGEAARYELQIDVNTRHKKLRVRPELAVLLEEFVERFDRRFLPIVRTEVDVQGGK